MKNKFIIMLVSAALALITLGVANAAPAAICTSGGTGNWTAITWNCGHVPTSSDDVVIAAGNIVTLDTNATILSLTANGTLSFGNNTTSRTLTITGSTTINASGTVNLTNNNAGHVLNLGGNFTNSGTFSGYQNPNRYIDVTFTGPGLQTISSSSVPTMRNLQVNSGSRVVFPAANLPTVNNTMTVIAGGAVQQTQTVNNGTFNFLQISTNKYLGIDLITTNNLGSTTVVITTTVSGGCTSTGTGSPVYATRCYSITPTTNAAATVRLYALTSELNTITLANLRVYRYTGGAWQQLTPNGAPTAIGSYSYATGDTTGFSAFLLGGLTAPTAVTISLFEAQSSSALRLLPIGLALIAAGAALLLVRRRAR